MAITNKCGGSVRGPHLRKQITIERKRSNLEENASVYRVSQRGNLNYYETLFVIIISIIRNYFD